MLPEPCNLCESDPKECPACRFYGQPNIRDFFAASALIAYGLSMERESPKSRMSIDFEAGSAYRVADAMLNAREAK